MARTIGIGAQDFEYVRRNDYFYMDKTAFIKEWWENGDCVTLITRPRRFGKTLNMNMLERFFSLEYAGKGDVFEGLNIWQEQKYRELQGTYPVMFLSFAGIKGKDYAGTFSKIAETIVNIYDKFRFLRSSDALTDANREWFDKVSFDMNENVAASSLHQLSLILSRYYGKKVIILLDEYDTPMQEAYVNGYWDDMVAFTRNLFNSTFKTNPYLERAIMTGITRVSKESIFSDLNNLEVVTTTSEKYATSFGFTEDEVFAAMDEYGMTSKAEVKEWYDGFTFGEVTDIYNPWSVINYLDKRRVGTYWANTSSNGLVSTLLRTGNASLKMEFEKLLDGESLHKTIDEQIVYNQLNGSESAIWSLLLASGYLKPENVVIYGDTHCDLRLTNKEVQMMFKGMVRGWFSQEESNYNQFVKALISGNLKEMNAYMNRVALGCFSYFDTGNGPYGAEPEKFYHGFVLGLIVELNGRYVITSNRESGFGRYDVMLEPLKPEDNAIIMEFKVHDADDEKDLHDTVAAALAQIDEKQYETSLTDKGISTDRIRKYGFAFEGKKVLIG